ncbi:hypothetical protein HMPREF3214_00031 [Alloscardovia omnicolens]|uniref:Uncharacterized protein n=1 Tax=Alloscardovia omnicolens F0580 TaxID=1321816 RepID=U1SMJ5_9BIFI|nr:hypothetical protein HMPREF9244_00316 [Alloscardovia omnicolens F0580]KWZ75838.1 hypothetical protein HMPREF3214_00031 [Alloscardovia omnicolens]
MADSLFLNIFSISNPFDMSKAARPICVKICVLVGFWPPSGISALALTAVG